MHFQAMWQQVMVSPWGCLCPSAAGPSIISHAKTDTHCPTPATPLTSQRPSLSGVCSASMQREQYGTSRVGNTCLPLNLMGYGCPVPPGAVVLLCLLRVAQQVSGRTWISMYISHGLCQGFCSLNSFSSCSLLLACKHELARLQSLALSAMPLAKENWSRLCMTPMQNHRLAGGAEKDIARKAETF